MDEDKVIQSLVQQGQDIDDIKTEIKENLVTKKDHQEVMSTLDKILGLVRKGDQEVTMMGSHVKRVEETADQNKRDIQQIKPLVGLAT